MRIIKCASIGAVLISQSGCIAQEEPKIVQSEPHPAYAAKTQQEHRDVGSPKAETAVSASAVDVTLTQPSECRDQTPMVRDVATERHANAFEQAVNVSGFAILGTTGIALLASTCTAGPAPTSSNPNPPSHPCSAEQRAPITGSGAAALVGGALFGAAFIYNVIKARDSKETVPAPAAEWQACASKPIANVPATLKFADGQTLSSTTDNAGHVSFQVASIRWTDDVLRAEAAEINVGGKTMSVSLASLPAYVEWKEKAQAIADAPPSVPSDPVELFTALSTMRPFNSQFIDFEGISKFVNYYAALDHSPEVTGPAAEVRRSIRIFNGYLALPTGIIQLTNLTTDRFKALAKNGAAGQIMAGALYDVIQLSGPLYLRFILAQKSRLSPDDLRGMQQQVTPGGPEQTNISEITRLQYNLKEEWNHAR